ncbi:helix-turn-helix transcriptional regulator [Ammoniphilus sp. CFH 90114]|uniref:helix-turn-helix transcriptional regulator n=1 Tax=Ammoniphilus sp. CFH 90114 TaxID=2493665 RepID=UPI0013E99596|nr:helix-turn-helix transcriptional regulator [Ammoniphilus sp. CFH 90114]
MKLTGNEISTLRNVAGLSQTELARQVNVTTTHISYIENGTRNMSEQLQKRIFECFSQFFTEDQLQEIVRMSRSIKRKEAKTDEK